MFNKKQIESLNKEVSDLKKEIEDLKSSLNNILDTLEGDNFSKDWEEYQKYKEMKDKLPDIEEMYKLKRLKELIDMRDAYWKKFEVAQSRYIEHKAGRHPNATVNALFEDTETKHGIYKDSIDAIDEIIAFFKKQMRQKDLIEVFKLYGISTEWLKP